MTIDEIKKQFKKGKNFEQIFETSKKSRTNFQRLEFLGDRVIGLALANELYLNFDSYDEGKMAKFYAYLTSGKVLSKIARKIHLEKVLFTKGIKNTTDNVLSDYLEAILGGYFVENGYIKTSILINNIYRHELKKKKTSWGDFKSILQEWSQGNDLGLPLYNLVEKRGPDHDPYFLVKVIIVHYDPVLGKGKSIQLAQQNAAKKFLQIEKIQYD